MSLFNTEREKPVYSQAKLDEIAMNHLLHGDKAPKEIAEVNGREITLKSSEEIEAVNQAAREHNVQIHAIQEAKRVQKEANRAERTVRRVLSAVTVFSGK